MKEYKTSEAQRRAVRKYDTESVECTLIRMPLGTKERINKHRAETGETLNGFLNRAIDETIKRDRGEID